MVQKNSIVLRSEQGFAMAGVLLVMILLAVVGSFSVLRSAIDVRSSAHFDTANRAFYAAESGVMHALGAMNGPGIINFQSDVVNRWDEYMASGPIGMPSDGRALYEVMVVADPADPRNGGWITAEGTAPLLARRTIRLDLRKGPFGGAPGAIHVAADDGVTSQFSGNAFGVDGNNYDRFGLPANDGIVVPGVSTRNDGVASTLRDSLNDTQSNNVLGTGYDAGTSTPSVLPVGGPGISDLAQFVDTLLNSGVHDLNLETVKQRNINADETFGTWDNPQITLMTANDVKLNGNAQGAGILIVEGSLTINGTLGFQGLVIVMGDTVIQKKPGDSTVTGTADILGSLWTGSLDLKVGGNADVNYCYECLENADTIGGQGGLIPRPMTVVAWGEV